jgi:CRISPR type III-B/RAMP module-associated protein Cmr5
MTLSQERSEFALRKLAQQSSLDSDFASYLAGLPTMVLNNGMAQAFAFIISKNDRKALKRQVLSWTIEWLHSKRWVSLPATASDSDFMRELSRMPQARYLACQRETLALWEWLKRYANSDLFGS